MTPLEFSAAQRRELGDAALAWVLRYFDEAMNGPVYPTIGATELEKLVAEPLPRTAQPIARVLEQFAQLAALGRNNGHPRMFGYVQSSGNFAGTVGDFLASALNQNVTSWRSAPSATAVELQTIEWIKTFVGCEAMRGGLLVSGGSAANFTALAAALRASTDVDINTHGVAALPGRPTIYASDRAHMSIAKAAALLGIGRDSVRVVATNTRGELNVDALRRVVVADRASGRHLVAVVANAGEVNTGAIDPIGAIADLCEEQGVWLHIDGAYGGFAAAAPAVRGALTALPRAHSVALDPHKWLFAPLDVGCVLVRDQESLMRAFAHGASYIDVVTDREMSDFAFWDISPELSRRFRALKLWIALKCHGADAFVHAIDRNIALAGKLAALIDASDDFERLADATLSIVCFRYVPKGLSGDTHALNDFNRRLLVDVQRDGDAYLSNVTLGGVFALRACLVNHRTTDDDLASLLMAIRRSAARL